MAAIKKQPAVSTWEPYQVAPTGMTLLDHFAGIAMGAMIAHHGLAPTTTPEHARSIAQLAYTLADAMLTEADDRT